MELAELLFSLGEILLIIASIPLIKTTIKNRGTDVAFGGALLTFIALLLFVSGNVVLTFWVPILLSIPTILFWALILYYHWRKK